MCNPSKEETPTIEEIRAARHAGFANSISYLPAEKRERLLESYMEKDATREIEVRRLVDNVKHTR